MADAHLPGKQAARIDSQNSSSTAVVIAEEITWHDCRDADLVLFNARDGTYHALNQTASAIWRALSNGRTVPATIAELAAEFPADAEAVADDVQSFVTEALRAGLLVPASVRSS